MWTLGAFILCESAVLKNPSQIPYKCVANIIPINPAINPLYKTMKEEKQVRRCSVGLSMYLKLNLINTGNCMCVLWQGYGLKTRITLVDC